MTTRSYIDNMNSTTHTIACGLVLATFYVVVGLVADLAGHPLGEHTMDTLGFFIASMLGIGAGQFTAKRFSDTGLAAAKAGAGPSTVIPSQQTNVQTGTTQVSSQQPPSE